MFQAVYVRQGEGNSDIIVVKNLPECECVSVVCACVRACVRACGTMGGMSEFMSICYHVRSCRISDSLALKRRAKLLMYSLVNANIKNV